MDMKKYREKRETLFLKFKETHPNASRMTFYAGYNAAQQMREPDVMPCGHPLAEAYRGEDGGIYCRICESA